jgi:hypothetical protein
MDSKRDWGHAKDYVEVRSPPPPRIVTLPMSSTYIIHHQLVVCIGHVDDDANREAR